jgi:RHS repeat-associated protein
MRYLPWGETRYEGSNIPTSYKYTGQREESSIGLYYYNARWYDAKLGRFTQADKLIYGLKEKEGSTPKNLQSWDRYNYVNNNPLLYIDFGGHFPIPLIIVGLVGMGLLFSQLPTDQYQWNPENWGDPVVALFGATLLAIPFIAEFLCADGNCLNELQAACRNRNCISKMNNVEFAGEEAVGRFLGLKEGVDRIADNLTFITRTARWLITETKGTDIGYGLTQLRSTLNALLSKVPSASGDIDLMLELNKNAFNQLTGKGIGNWTNLNGYLARWNELGEKVYYYLDGLLVKITFKG